MIKLPNAPMRLGCGALACFAALATAVRAADSANTPKPFKLDAEPVFQSYKPAIVQYLKAIKHRSNTALCVFGEEYADGTKLAWVTWNPGHTMLLWDGGDQDLRRSPRKINLNKDFVANDTAVQGSTYRVTQASVAGQTEKCDKSGTKVVITRADLVTGRTAALANTH